MTKKVFQALVTPSGTNEQTGVGQITATASGNAVSRGIAAGAAKALFFLDVSAASGTTPSLTVSVEGQDPGSLKWIQIVAFPAQTTTTSGTPITPLSADPLYYQQVRVRWVISGTTPSFTFSAGAMFFSGD